MFLGRLLRGKNDLIKGRLPVHIAIIPDGNGRWAQRRGLPRNVGHREGANTFRRVAKACSNMGIKYLTLYAFSTENWKRPKSEVDSLMDLLMESIKKADSELGESNIRIRVIGDIGKLSPELQSEIKRVVMATRENTGMTVVFALNYGGRDEIVQAVKKVIRDVGLGTLTLEDLNEKTFSERLFTAGIPDPDLIIRTSGEKRVSNFLLWQMAYSEFWYTDVFWPDFKEQHLMEAIRVYQKRKRRFGGI